jgi:hypothetical protein
MSVLQRRTILATMALALLLSPLAQAAVVLQMDLGQLTGNAGKI